MKVSLKQPRALILFKDNVYQVAQNFLAKNDLPQSYIEQIVEFIDRNTGGVHINTSRSADPFTGKIDNATLIREADQAQGPALTRRRARAMYH
jgi:hypothetical protein